MFADGGRGSARRRGFTLVEVAVSMLLATTVITAAMMGRYLSVKQARRADAYNGAGRLGLLMLEGWRSYAECDDYDPVANFGQTSAMQMTIGTSGSGPDGPTDFMPLGSYHVVLDNANYYVTLAYIKATTTAPAKLHAAVAFRHQYQAEYDADEVNVVRLTTYD